MNFTSSALALLLAITTPITVDSHTTELRLCVTLASDLRIFVRHWHGFQASATDAGKLDITDDIANITLSLTPTGVINDVDETLLATVGGCGVDTAPLVGVTCTTLWEDYCGDGPYDHWVYYDFPLGSCGQEVRYTLNTGAETTEVLDEGCDDWGLYVFPGTISRRLPCPGESWDESVSSKSQKSSKSTYAPSESPTLAGTPTSTTKSQKSNKSYSPTIGAIPV